VIVVDTSALMAVALDGPQADACIAALETDDVLLISAVSVAEALIVAESRGVRDIVSGLIEGLGMEVVAVTQASARGVAETYGSWGKGMHPAGLNFGDCFAYEVARDRGCSLLYVGNDFSKTDIRGVLEKP
jgi:ribonuclease VapC